MKVLRAEYAGACYGVQRALDMVEAEAHLAKEKGESTFTLGPLIHNPQVVARLEEQGVLSVSGLDDLPFGLPLESLRKKSSRGTLIIRTHGVAPQVKREAKARGFTVVDATCPYVARAQSAAAELAAAGFYVLVIGEEGHPEVEGIVAHAREIGGEACVVAAVADLPELEGKPCGVVVQTTQSKEALETVAAALREAGIDLEVKDTICAATRERQEATKRLSREVDAFIVVGGRNSSNTTRLYEIAKAQCGNCHHIETPEEIDPRWFTTCETVGLTAGASTPEDQIDAVVAHLEAL